MVGGYLEGGEEGGYVRRLHCFQVVGTYSGSCARVWYLYLSKVFQVDFVRMERIATRMIHAAVGGGPLALT